MVERYMPPSMSEEFVIFGDETEGREMTLDAKY
jgi:hypothetical protein